MKPYTLRCSMILFRYIMYVLFVAVIAPKPACADALDERSLEFCRNHTPDQAEVLDQAFNQACNENFFCKSSPFQKAMKDAVLHGSDNAYGVGNTSTVRILQQKTLSIIQSLIEDASSSCLKGEAHTKERINDLTKLGFPDQIKAGCDDSRSYDEYASCLRIHAAFWAINHEQIAVQSDSTSLRTVDVSKACAGETDSLKSKVCAKEEERSIAILHDVWSRIPDNIKTRCILESETNKHLIVCIGDSIGNLWWNGTLTIH